MATETETPAAGDLPGIEGKGVAPVSIASINKLVKAYLRKKEARNDAGKEFTEAEDALSEEIHKHEEEIGVDNNGEIVYRYEDNVITVKPGKEKLKVKAVKSLVTPEDI